MLKNYLTLFLFLGILSCKKAESPPPAQINSFYKEVITADDRKTITPQEAKTYHVDKTFQYEYRTGTSGNYEYNYDVKGLDAKGDSVYGNINVQGKYGAGILNAENFRDIDINTEWVAYGKLKATDKNGNEYDLIVD
ncbi:hypothetical protein [Flavobacterium piscis]|uniref:Uncharacterized protein n=1 Tax=Flavobacterium piscis TaxID=1114874 RepID=A0ABU1YEJ4_9FLAO|nr:hypothetical protein [Flavobacterium piscis]MDR7212652.1 hypothetical protein [Flavobacterium piscis]